MIVKYFNFIMKQRKLLYVLLVLSLVLSIVGIRKLDIEVDFNLFSSEDSAFAETMKTLDQSFVTNQLTLLLAFDYDSFKLSDMILVPSLIEKVKSLPSFDEENLPDMSIKDMMNNIKLDDFNKENLMNEFKSLGPLSPLSLWENTLYFRMDLPIKNSLSLADLDKLETYLESLEIDYYIAGDDYMQNKIFDYILSILKFIPPMALFGIFIVFSWQMGTIKGTVLSLLPAVVGGVWTMGMVGHLGKGVSVVTVLAPIFTIIIGSADGLHFVSHFQEAYEKVKDKNKAILETLQMVGMPMIITTLTTMIGFLSLLTLGEEIISTLVVMASLGVFLAGIATWLLVPLILSSNLSIKTFSNKNKKALNFFKILWGKPIIILIILLTPLSLWLIKDIKTDFNQLMFYKEDTVLYKNFQVIEEASGGGVPIMVMYEWQEGQSPYETSKVIEEALAENPYVSKVMGISSIVEISTIDKSPLINSFYNGQRIEEGLIDPSKRLGRVIAFPKTIDDKALEDIERTVDNLKLDIKPKITSVQLIMKDLNNKMLDDQVTTQILAFVVIGGLIYLALRKFALVVITLTPIFLTNLFLYGYLAVTHIPLNLFTILMFSISIGIGIDYAIHFVSVWHTYKKQGKSTEESLELSYAYTSRPILANALGLSIGMSALLLSPLKIHTYLSLVMWFTMVMSVILTLTLLPTLLKKWRKS